MKTRLAAGIGSQAALDAYLELLCRAIDQLTGAGPWTVELAVTPDASVEDASAWPRPTFRRPQGPGDLGERLIRALAQASPAAPVLVVGSDVPELGPREALAAFEALVQADLVLGPAPDGGYWAIGASRPPPPHLLDGVRWSSPETRADTLANAGTLGTNVRVLDRWLEDVDDAAGWARWRSRRAGVQALQEAPPSTQNLLQCGWLSATAPDASASVGPRSKPSA